MNMLPLEPGSPFEASFLNKTPVDRWDVDDVLEWLMGVGCGEYNAQFRANHIDGQVLLVLERSSLKQLINRVGDRIKIQQGIKRLRIRENLSLPASASHAHFEDLSATASASVLPSMPPSASASSTSINAVAGASAEISIVYPDGNSRTVGLPSSLRTATDAKHIILKEVFPSIGKTAAAAWAISRGDHMLTEQETLALAQGTTNTGVLRIHQVDPPSTTTARQRGSHRPTSRHVSAHLKEYFPNVPSGELEQTVRNSVMLTRRLSTYDPAALDLRRLSNMPSLQAPPPSAPSPVAPKAPPKTRPQTLHSPNAASQSLNTDAQQLLDQFKAEEMTPSRWIRGQMIGSGSFGTVYMGMNAFTGELLAVKQVEIPENEIDEGRKKKMVDALKHEVHLMRGFDHANIVQYRGFKHETNTLNIFLEYVPGGSLVSMLNQYGSFEEKLVSHYVGQILAGLEYLHKRQVIHRDIKGANILVDDKGNCKISDFGLSKKMETQQLLQSNRQSMQGSTFWMAPEVVKQMAPTMKSDIWSLGCVVIELLTGSHPFPQLTQMQAIFKLGNLVQPEIPEDCSAEAKDFLKKTLEVDRAKRPNATELRAHKFAERAA